jgi:[protein-PII] uridylyltransferase
MTAEPEEVFLASMPAAYAAKVSRELRPIHARIAESRGRQLVSIGVFPSGREGTAGLCVVAEDRPGLLATISAALYQHGFNVLDAEAYTRVRADDTREAVDLFWVRRTAAQHLTLLPSEVEALRATLTELLEGHRSLEAPKVAQPAGETRVRFLEAENGTYSTLEVQGTDRPGLLLALTQALFQNRVQIASCEVRTIGGMVLDRFELEEHDGRAISPDRQLEIQVAVLSAIGDQLLS